MTEDEINGFLVKESGLTLDYVYRLSYYEKLIILGYRPRTNSFQLLNPVDLSKPAHLKKPMPGKK